MTGLDVIIGPEVNAGTATYHVIQEYLKRVPVKNVIEIGASSGGGTTEALIKGILAGPTKGSGVRMASLEVSRARFKNLKERYDGISFFRPYNTSSLPLSRFPSADQVRQFCHDTGVFGATYEGVIPWLEQDINYVVDNNFDDNGIQKIKDDFGVTKFDLACIDGSEFLGYEEFKELPDCDAYVLDDIYVHKNFFSHKELLQNPAYVLIFEEKIRNGSSMFCKREIAAKYLGLSV